MRRPSLFLFPLSCKGLFPFLCLFVLLLTSGCGLFSRAVEDQRTQENDTALFNGDPVPYTVTFRIVRQNGRHTGDAPGRMAEQVEDGATNMPASTSSSASAGETVSASASSSPSETPSDSASKTSAKNSADEKNSALRGKAAPSGPNHATDIPADAADEELLSLMRSNSGLEQLLAQPPDSMLGLERRARSDRDVALKAMRSLGFYDGRVRFHLDKDSSPVKVLFDLLPGTRYTVGALDIAYEPEPVVPDTFRNRTITTGLFWKEEHKLPPPSFPARIRGLKEGMAVSAGAILDAVEKWPNRFKNYGYPFAHVSSSRYFLDKEHHSLTVRTKLDPGPAATMGEVRFSGLENVGEEYLRRLIPWKPGTPWSDRMMERYRNSLLETGLFRSVDLRPLRLDELESSTQEKPAENKARPEDSVKGESSLSAPASPPLVLPSSPFDPPLELPVAVDLGEMAFRTVGASLRYSTDKGMGIQGSWEHRNFFGNGEKLTVAGTVSEDEQGVKLDFKKPAFLRADQSLIADGHFGRKITDAYTAREASIAAGLERKLAPFWWGSARGGFVQGEIDEGYGTEEYDYAFMDFGIRRDTRNNPLNPTRGSRLVLALAPYEGHYLSESFTAFMPRVDFSTYYKPFRKDWLVLAARVAAGGMFGARSTEVPATLRYYVGGGGSVRGYAYQAIGPRNSRNDPEGGTSFQEINLEMRFKVTENIGIVPFLDGGMVYESAQPDWGKDLDWGAGIGLRYFTPVGPLRLDFGVPLTKIPGEKNYQIYISLGQSF